jgi:hypothetical protein
MLKILPFLCFCASQLQPVQVNTYMVMVMDKTRKDNEGKDNNGKHRNGKVNNTGAI